MPDSRQYVPCPDGSSCEVKSVEREWALVDSDMGGWPGARLGFVDDSVIVVR